MLQVPVSVFKLSISCKLLELICYLLMFSYWWQFAFLFSLLHFWCIFYCHCDVASEDVGLCVVCHHVRFVMNIKCENSRFVVFVFIVTELSPVMSSYVN